MITTVGGYWASTFGFSREGRAGTRVIRIHTRAENTVSTVSIVRDKDHDPRANRPPPTPVGAVCDESRRSGAGVADDADVADAKPLQLARPDPLILARSDAV